MRKEYSLLDILKDIKKFPNKRVTLQSIRSEKIRVIILYIKWNNVRF